MNDNCVVLFDSDNEVDAVLISPMSKDYILDFLEGVEQKRGSDSFGDYLRDNLPSNIEIIEYGNTGFYYF